MAIFSILYAIFGGAWLGGKLISEKAAKSAYNWEFEQRDKVFNQINSCTREYEILHELFSDPYGKLLEISDELDHVFGEEDWMSWYRSNPLFDVERKEMVYICVV